MIKVERYLETSGSGLSGGSAAINLGKKLKKEEDPAVGLTKYFCKRRSILSKGVGKVEGWLSGMCLNVSRRNNWALLCHAGDFMKKRGGLSRPREGVRYMRGGQIHR